MEKNCAESSVKEEMRNKATSSTSLEENIKKKNRKEPIPAALKNLVWNTFVGVQHGHWLCFFCHKEIISRQTFRVGHIKSQAYGGPTSIENLRPFCVSCNEGMGTEHAEEYAKKYGFPFRVTLRPRMDSVYVESIIANLHLLSKTSDSMQDLTNALESLAISTTTTPVAASMTGGTDVNMGDQHNIGSSLSNEKESKTEKTHKKVVRCKALLPGGSGKHCSRAASDSIYQLCKQHLQIEVSKVKQTK